MIEELLPSGVVSAESWSDEPSAPLFSEERAYVSKAVESRAREFATARSLARHALGRLGVPATPIGRGSAGQPTWPSGTIGSITHCAGYRAAAVARSTQLQTLGIDAEIDDALPPEVVASVLVAEEIDWIEKAGPLHHWDRVLFSAKESVYKAWFPLTLRWLDFSEVAVHIDPAAGTFCVRPIGGLPDAPAKILRLLSGRFLLRGGIILTSVSLPQRIRYGITARPVFCPATSSAGNGHSR